MSRRARRIRGTGNNRPQQQKNKQIREQIDPTYWSSNTALGTQEDFYWYPSASGSEEDRIWRRISDTWYQKDLLPSTYLELHNSCYEAFNSNPLAFGIIEMTTSFVLGEGITVSAKNKRVQAVIDEFWNNSENYMDSRVYSLCTELSLYGEQFVHFFVNQYDGTVVIRQIDPSLIDQIETDPEDVEKPLRYHRRPIAQIMSATAGDPPHFDPTQEQDTQGQWFEAGTEVVQFTINKVSNAKRGKSDLATLLPWLRRYKDWLTDRVRINKYKAAFLWDVQLTGADKKTIDRKKMEYTYPPEPGSVIIHNEAEKWSAVEPNINANDASEDGRQIKMMVAVGATLPEHYLSDGDNGNRATASEMSLPTLLKFKRRQRQVKHMLTIIIDRVIAEALKAGKIGPRIDTSYEITFPEIDSGEHTSLAQGMNWLLPALQTAAGQGWISNETAMKIMFEYCGEEIDIPAEMEKIAQQKAQQQAQASQPGQTTQQNNTPDDQQMPLSQKPSDLPSATNGYGSTVHPAVTYDRGF